MIAEACREVPKTSAELVPVVFHKHVLDAHQTGFAAGELIAHVNYMLVAGPADRPSRQPTACCASGPRDARSAAVRKPGQLDLDQAIDLRMKQRAVRRIGLPTAEFRLDSKAGKALKTG